MSDKNAYLEYADYLYTIWCEKSFTAAAERLGISRPNLSRTVIRIENEIGHKIFERCGKEIMLTEIGERYMSAIDKILKVHTKLSSDLDRLGKTKKRKITVGTTNFIGSYILPKIIKDFTEVNKEIEVKIIIDKSIIIEDKLKKGEVDIIIDHVTAFISIYDYIPLIRERVFLGVNRDSKINSALAGMQLSEEALARGRASSADDHLPKVDLHKLEGERFILEERWSKLHQIAKQIFDETGTKPRVSMEFKKLDAVVGYALSGHGVCFLSDLTYKYVKGCDELSIYLPDTAYSDMRLYIIHERDKYLPSAMRAFIDHIANTKI